MEASLDAARSVVNGNNCAALLVLTPVQHSGVKNEIIFSKRRTLEDKLFAFLDSSSCV